MGPTDHNYAVLWAVLVIVVDSVYGAPKCPPGGVYLDKHVGQYGRLVCCSELCEPPGLFQDQCKQKCPNYAALQADSERDSADNVRDTLQQHDSSSSLAYISIPVAVVLITIAVVFVLRRGGRHTLSSVCPALPFQGRRTTLGMNRETEPDVGQNQLQAGQQAHGTERAGLLSGPAQYCPPAEGQEPCVYGGHLSSPLHTSGHTSAPHQTAECSRRPVQAEQEGNVDVTALM